MSPEQLVDVMDCGRPDDARTMMIKQMEDRACRFVRERLREHQISSVAQRLKFARKLSWEEVSEIMKQMELDSLSAPDDDET